MRTRNRKISAGSYTSEKVGLRLTSRLISEIWWVRAGIDRGSGEEDLQLNFLHAAWQVAGGSSLI